MTYSYIWDETVPADTQLAKLGASDIRGTRVNVRERIASFGAGTLANRPTPEAVFAGVTYFATDTKQFFNWNGTVWVDISSVLSGVAGVKIYENHVPVTVTNPVADTDGQTVTIPASTLSAGKVVEIEASMQKVSGSADLAMWLAFGTGSGSNLGAVLETSVTAFKGVIRATSITLLPVAPFLFSHFFSCVTFSAPILTGTTRVYAGSTSQTLSSPVVVKTYVAGSGTGVYYFDKLVVKVF